MTRGITLGMVLLVVGCATAPPTPTTLPLPQRPRLMWRLVPDPDGGRAWVCLSQPDGNKLADYTEQLQEFEEAWSRLKR